MARGSIKLPLSVCLHFHSNEVFLLSILGPPLLFSNNCRPDPDPPFTVVSNDLNPVTVSLTFSLGVALLLEHLSTPGSVRNN